MSCVHAKAFCVDERGGVSILLLIFFILIILTTGVGLDLLRHEAHRAELQDALDRGVLAASSLSQSLDAETTVISYLDRQNYTRESVSVTVAGRDGVGSREVEAIAEYQLDTLVLRMAGLPTLPVRAYSKAVHNRPPVEISLLLDISGTMRFDTNNSDPQPGESRLGRLQPAATNFIDVIMADGADAVTTVNLVRYAGQVNPGPLVFELLGGVRDHGESSCLEFTDSDLDAYDLPSAGLYAQVPHFHHWAIDTDWMDWGWCPSDDMGIIYASNDADILKSEINSIRLHDGTGTYNAMKWGMALLNPGSQPTMQTLSDHGLVDPAFADRPVAWDDPDALKFIILMTDGQITRQNRPKNPSNPALAREEVRVFGHPYRKTHSRAEGLKEFYGLCDAAKANGVIVFTIAFEAPKAAQEEMRNCASSEAHFYDVEDLEIHEAFQEIATTISKLKLVG